MPPTADEHDSLRKAFVVAFMERELLPRDLHFVVDNHQSFRLAGLANRKR
jgi:hypothetical protein